MGFPSQFQLDDLRAITSAEFDEIIDVRSPAEFADDHIPGAINLPVMSNLERAEVGTIYKQQSPFLARKLGAAIVARNAAHHLETHLAAKEGSYRPLIHCWRGGQRSNSFALILGQIGWRVSVLQGGYKTYRNLVIDALYQQDLPRRLLLLDGNTGTAKTAILHRLAGKGVQVLDLEGLANHRGSLFGHWDSPQPSQRLFESRLAQALHQMDPALPILVEAESSKIGNLRLPPRLWAQMKAAPRIEITAPLAARATWLIEAYQDILADRERLMAMINSLRPLQPETRIAAWLALAKSGADPALAAELMAHHYDPRYARHRERGAAAELHLHSETLDPAGQEQLADAIAARLRDLGPQA